MPKSTKVVYWALVPLISLSLVGAGSVSYVDSAGGRFFNNGRQIKEDLGGLAHVFTAKDYGNIAPYFAANYGGSALGLNSPKQTELKDWRSPACLFGRQVERRQRCGHRGMAKLSRLVRFHRRSSSLRRLSPRLEFHGQPESPHSFRNHRDATWRGLRRNRPRLFPDGLPRGRASWPGNYFGIA